MPRLQATSKYCVSRASAASASSNAVPHAHAVERRLLDAVHERGLREAGDVEHGRRDVDHVVELAADLALALMPFGQCTIMPLRVPPKCDATCFVHWYGVFIAWAQPTA